VWLCGSCDEDGYDDGVDHLIARGIEDFDFDDEA
jgi:hypothetical protein